MSEASGNDAGNRRWPWPQVSWIVRDLRDTDRTGLRTPDPGPSRVTKRSFAWVAIAVLYALGWGMGILAAVLVLNGAEAPPQASPDRLPSTVASLVVDVFVVTLALVVMRVFRGQKLPREHWRPMLRTVPLTALAMLVGFIGVSLVSAVLSLEKMSYPFPDMNMGLSTILWTLSLLLAGPTEEFVLVGVVATVLRRTGYSWWTVAAVAVVLRIPFHLYYGWGAIGMAVWAVLVAALYRRTGSLLGLAIGHALYNVLTLAGPFAGVGRVALALAGLGLAIHYLASNLQTDRHLPAPSLTSR